MVFSSLTFVGFFLPAVILLYFLCKSLSGKNAVLLVFSLLFYAWGEPKWILVMLLSVTVNYFCALGMGKHATPAARRLLLVLGVGLAIGFLVYFKYFAFLANALLGLFSEKRVAAKTLPIGISFYTFQLLTYTIDVYRGKCSAQRSYAKLLLYISFFPQLIAGPIVNYKDIEEALSTRRSDMDSAFAGLSRFAVGLGKKAILANTCGALLANIPLGEGLSVLGAWVSALAFSFQIYFDFSGYSDMAIGMGEIFGFRFKENFNYPYISRSVSEFWRRWHISLGSFFREYVYIPLGGNRVGKLRLMGNIFVVWTLTGFWHGAEWNFLLWGFYYGVLLYLEKLLLGKKQLPAILGRPVTLLLVLIGWIFFYYEGGTGQALRHIGALFGVGAGALSDSATVYYLKSNLGVLLLSAVCSVPWLPKLRELRFYNSGRTMAILRPILTSALLVLSVIMLVGQTYNPFLYFRF